MTNEKIIEELENIESQLNEDSPNVSDIRIDVALLIKELTEPHFVSGCGGLNSFNYEDIHINGC